MKKIHLIILVVFNITLLHAQCIDFTNLRSPDVTCYYGTYSNPTSNIGVKDHGWDPMRLFNNDTTRHTVITTSVKDPITQAFYVVPPGESASVRLGNSNVYSQAEAISYRYHVNAQEAPILILKYAAVLEEPGHNEEPKFTLEILDNHGNIINPDCASFNFVANSSLGWAETIYTYGASLVSHVFYKTWTTIGVNLADYDGQDIQIRLTTYDCNHSGHFGYAYFTLGCAESKIKVLSCGDANSITFSAPDGFNYQWYKKEGLSKIVVGTAQTVTVPVGDDTYYCDVSQIGKPSCYFTLTAVPEKRYPIADFAITKHTACVDTIFLTNNSGISSDGVFISQPVEPCEEARWELGDGRVYSVYDISGLPITYAESGTYTIRLTTSIGKGQCTSVKEKTITVHGYNDPHTSDISASFCKGTEYNFLGTKLTTPGNYTKTIKTQYGCDSIINLALSEWPTYIKDTFAMKCPGTQIRIHNMIISRPGVYLDTLRTIYGCDSIIKWNVDEYQSYIIDQHAQICQSESFRFNNQDLHRAGDYYDTLHTIHGCDSIIHLMLKVNPNYYYEDIAIVCSNEPYDFHGRILYTSGIYYDSLMTADGCDSVYKLTLTVLPAYLKTEYLEICEGTVLTYRGKQIMEPGIYYDSLYTATGCDSVYKIVVNRAATYFYESHAQIEVNGTYNFNGRILTEAGVYYDSLRTVSGCDSIFKLTLHENPIYYYEDSVSLCQSELPYDFHGRLLYQSGIYYDSLSTQIGSDSIYRLHLTIHPTYERYDIMDLCDGDSVWFGGRYLYNAGLYSDTLKTRMGCDSIFHLTINHAKSYYFRDSIALPIGDTYTFHGQTIRVSGTYYDYQKTYQGCDSIYEQIVMFYPTYRFIEKDTICSSEAPYLYHGKSYYESGVYYDSLHTSMGFDSIYELHLTVLPAYLKTEYLEICEGSVLTYRGKQIFEQGIYYDTLFTKQGCDSIFKIIVNRAATYYFESHAQIEKGGTYDFNGRILSEAGVYYDSLRTVSGCDSIFKLTLHANPIYYYEDSVAICQSEAPYDFHGRLLYKSGIYYDSLSTQIGSDSIYRLALTIHPTYESYDIIDLCEGDSVWFGGEYIYNAGMYSDTLKTRMGCDSIFHLTVNRAKSYYFRDSVALAVGQTYNFHGQVIRTSGTYFDYQKTYQGCDSIYEQIVMFYPTYRFIEKDTICSSEAPYLYHGKSYYESGVYYDSLHTSMGFDSIYELHLTIPTTYIFTKTYEICEGTEFKYHDILINKKGIYYDTLISSLGCDSICKLVVNYAPKYLFTIRDSMPDASSYNFRGKTINKPGVYYDSLLTINGCDSVYQLILTKKNTNYVYSKENICHCKTPYLFFGQNIYQSGTYYYFKNDTTYQLDLTVNPDYEIVNYLEICEGSVLTFRGKKILEQGIYYDSLYTRQGCDSIYKIIVNRAASYMVDIEKSICKGNYYKFGGQNITKQGIYYDTLQARTTSCDSIIRLILTVREPDEITTYDTICDFETYMFNGQAITQSGTYHIHSYNEAGCDSTHLLYLTVLPTQYIYDTVHVCKGETYTFGTRVLTTVGDYRDTLCNTRTNQSAITLLHLAEVEPTSLDTIPSLKVCADSKSFDINLMYTNKGIKPDHYSISFNTAASKLGFKDIYDQPLDEDIITINMPYPDSSNVYLRPNKYALHLELKNLLCSNVTLKYDIPFEIQYPSWIIEQNWNDVVAILNKDYNGGYDFIRYEWYINDIFIPEAIKSYLYYPLQIGDEVYAVITRTDGVKVSTCPISITSNTQNREYPILVYPTYIKAGQRIHIKARTKAAYTIYSIMGSPILSGETNVSGEEEIFISNTGAYLIYVVTDNDAYTEKVLVQ